MGNLLNDIKELSKSLPNRDLKIANKYIEKRLFDRLLEIVESDIYLVLYNETLEVPKEKYKDINLENLLELKAKLEEYISFIDFPTNSLMYD